MACAECRLYMRTGPKLLHRLRPRTAETIATAWLGGANASRPDECMLQNDGRILLVDAPNAISRNALVHNVLASSSLPDQQQQGRIREVGCAL